MIPLPLAGNGATVRVLHIAGGRGVYRKLHELGIYIGAHLRIVNSWGAGPVIIEILDANNDLRAARIVIGYGLAMKIYVEIIS